MAYNVFISYRRKGAGAGVAGELQTKLENRGYKVFLDVDDIDSGEFPEQIDHAIKESTDFLLILSQGALDCCVDEEDWVRHEIVLAEQLGKNIIGVSLPGFVMPMAEDLPAPLRDLPNKQVFLWSHEYRKASLEKIEQNMVSARLKSEKKRKKRKIFSAAFGIVAAVLVAVVCLWVNKDDNVEEPIVKVKNQPDVVSAFVAHAKRGMNLTDSLADPSTKADFHALMEGIAEYDSALMLKNEYGDKIMDSFNIEAKRNALMKVRAEKMEKKVKDVEWALNYKQEGVARQYFEIVKILATDADKDVLDDLEKQIEK